MKWGSCGGQGVITRKAQCCCDVTQRSTPRTHLSTQTLSWRLTAAITNSQSGINQAPTARWSEWLRLLSFNAGCPGSTTLGWGTKPANLRQCDQKNEMKEPGLKSPAENVQQEMKRR